LVIVDYPTQEERFDIFKLYLRPFVETILLQEDDVDESNQGERMEQFYERIIQQKGVKVKEFLISNSIYWSGSDIKTVCDKIKLKFLKMQMSFLTENGDNLQIIQDVIEEQSNTKNNQNMAKFREWKRNKANN